MEEDRPRQASLPSCRLPHRSRLVRRPLAWDEPGAPKNPCRESDRFGTGMFGPGEHGEPDVLRRSPWEHDAPSPLQGGQPGPWRRDHAGIHIDDIRRLDRTLDRILMENRDVLEWSEVAPRRFCERSVQLMGGDL